MGRRVVVEWTGVMHGCAMHWIHIGERWFLGCRLLALEGRAEVGGEGTVVQRVQQLLASGDRRLVIDLERISAIDSAGIGALVRCHQLVEQHQGRVVFVNLQPRIKRYLTTAGLLTVLEIADTAEDGLQRLGGTR